MIKKILNFLPILFTLFMVSGGIWMGFGIYRHNNPNVKAGQVWVVRYDKDPFMKSRIDTISILEVDGDYCKYIKFGHVTSDTKRWAVSGAELIKDVK